MPEMAFPQLSIAFRREAIPVDTLTPQKVADEAWRHIDSHGHLHAWYEKDVPTLEWVVTGTVAVGDEFEMDEIDVGEWRCRQCADVVEPGMRTTYGPTHVAGPATYEVTIADEEFTLTPEQYVKSLERWAREIRRLLGRG